MRKGFLILLLVAAALSGFTQNTGSKAKLTNKSIVKDSSGNQYPVSAWKQMLISGNFTVDPVDPSQESSEFVLRRLTFAEKKKMLEGIRKPKGSGSFKTGAQFASFSATDINGNKYSLDELKGKVVVINFWFINCPPCRMEIPELNEMVESFKGNKDVVFLAIALDEKTRLQQFLQQMPYHYNVIDDGRNLAMQYKVNSFPTHVVIGRDGKIKFHTDGLAVNTIYWIEKSISQALADHSGIAQVD